MTAIPTVLLVALASTVLGGCRERFTPLEGPVASRSASPPVHALEPLPSIDEPFGPRYFGGEADGKLHVWFLDVGQGDATLIQSPSGKTVLVDGGPTEAGPHLSRRLPELLGGPLDLVVVTHPHEDHYGGLIRAFQVVGAKRFLAAPGTTDSPRSWAQLLHTLHVRAVPITAPEPDPSRPGAPLRIDLGGGAWLEAYWPRVPAESRGGQDGVEASSVVARVVYRDSSLLLTGDATGETEARLLSLRLPFRSDLLKVARHGGPGSSSDAFLDLVKPRVAIVQVGAGNGRGMPSGATLARLERRGATVLRTDLDGEIRADSDGTGWTLTPENAPAGSDHAATTLISSTRTAPERGTVLPARYVRKP